jgi:hypothetical protein
MSENLEQLEVKLSELAAKAEERREEAELKARKLKERFEKAQKEEKI